MIRRPPRSTQSRSSAASDVYKRQINSDDRAIIGKGIPDGFGTFSNTFRYGNLELLVDLQFQYGNSIMYRDEHSAEDRQTIANSFKTVLNAWTPDNQDTDIA